jgi:hypothetical protein
VPFEKPLQLQIAPAPVVGSARLGLAEPGEASRWRQALSLAPVRRIRAIEIAETLALVGVITLLGILLPNQRGFLAIQPHPLWLPALGIGFRYGGQAGYFAALLSALAYALVIAIDPMTGFHFPASKDLIQPFVMLVAGFVVTEVTSARARRQAAVESALSSKTLELERAAERLEVLTVAKGELEERVLNQTQTLVTLTEVGKQLQKTTTAELHQAVLRVLADCLSVQSASIYACNGDLLHLVASYPNDDIKRPQHLPISGALEQVVRQGKVASIRDLMLSADADGQMGQILLAGAVYQNESAPCAIVVVERMPFQKLTPTTVRQFEMLLDWASASYRNTQLFEGMLAWASVTHQRTRLLREKAAGRSKTKTKTAAMKTAATKTAATRSATKKPPTATTASPKAEISSASSARRTTSRSTTKSAAAASIATKLLAASRKH